MCGVLVWGKPERLTFGDDGKVAWEFTDAMSRDDAESKLSSKASSCRSAPWLVAKIAKIKIKRNVGIIILGSSSCG